MEDPLRIGRHAAIPLSRDRAAHEPLVRAGRPARERHRLARGGRLRRVRLASRSPSEQRAGSPRGSARWCGRWRRTRAASRATASWPWSGCAAASRPRSPCSARAEPRSRPRASRRRRAESKRRRGEVKRLAAAGAEAATASAGAAYGGGAAAPPPSPLGAAGGAAPAPGPRRRRRPAAGAGATGVAVVPPVPPVAGGVLGVRCRRWCRRWCRLSSPSSGRCWASLIVGPPPTPRSAGVLSGAGSSPPTLAITHDQEQEDERRRHGRDQPAAPVDLLGLTPGRPAPCGAPPWRAAPQPSGALENPCRVVLHAMLKVSAAHVRQQPAATSPHRVRRSAGRRRRPPPRAARRSGTTSAPRPASRTRRGAAARRPRGGARPSRPAGAGRRPARGPRR